MDFVALKIAAVFAMPVGLACLGLLLALLLSWRSPWASRLLLLCSLLLLGGLASDVVGHRLMDGLEGKFPIPPESVRAEAAVILGGTIDVARSTPERVELYDRPERVVEGVRLLQAGRAERLVLSGGSGDPRYPEAAEADFMAVFARYLGVADDRLILQRESRNTHEDAVKTAALLQQRGVDSFFLVTSAFHMPRAVGCFRKAGLNPIAYPVDFRGTPPKRGLLGYLPTAASLYASNLALHEYIGYVAYRILGYL